VLLWDEYAYVKHTANLSEYMRRLDDTTNICELHHRIARKFYFLSIIKLVAGAPDAGDLKGKRFTEMQLTNANTRHVAINTNV